MAKIISIMSLAGASGKTSFAYALGVELSKKNNKVLLIDADMQSSLTMRFNLENSESNLYKALMSQHAINHIQHTSYENLDLLPGSFDVVLIERTVEPSVSNGDSLLECMNKLIADIVKSNHYDYIIIDTAPHAGLMNKAIACVSDYILTPILCNPFHMHHISLLQSCLSSTQEEGQTVGVLNGVFIKPRDFVDKVSVDQFIKIAKEHIGEASLLNIPSIKPGEDTFSYMPFNEVTDKVIEKVKELR